MQLKNRSLIFDFDGTIADTLKLHEKAFILAFQELDVEFDYNDYLGQTTANTVKSILKKNDLHLPEDEVKVIIAKKKDIANSLIHTEITFIDGANDFIEAAYKLGIPLYVASSGSKKNVTAGLKKLGIINYFKGIITADDVTHSKPHPEIFETVVKNFNLNKSRSIVFEDSVSGIEAACAAKIPVVCVNNKIDVERYVSVICINFAALLKHLVN
ncbi:HAD family phosphatase [Ferruginibacter lapsinanis]|uniref:HAD family hydrolase n=1 Tax=Ferruginibacter lapsinanis TaxID=563172 RepID=UPI001E2BE939|nr:HAD family phosphatase [Ferruginibacter lapsinanis]UEG50554.1 HAD family phosphatase [Ferruginibacter lapsinanis]